MTQTKVILSTEGVQKTVKSVLEKAIELFPALNGYELCYGSRIEKEIKIKERINTGFIRANWVEQERRVGWEQAIDVDYDLHNYDEIRPQFSSVKVDSAKLEFDDVAIWVGGQLEKLFDVCQIEVNDPSKLGHAIGWRCAYCNSLNTGKACEHCGAPRAW
jgi:hypothetical protein